MKKLTAAVSVLALAMATGAHAAQENSILSTDKASVTSDRGALASANRATPLASIGAALEQRGVGRATIDTLAPVSEYTDGSGRMIGRYQQVIDGLRVHGSYAKAVFQDGSLVHLIDRLAPAGGRAARPSLSEEEALRIAVDQNFGSGVSVPGFDRRDGAVSLFKDTDFFYRGPRVEKLLIARGNGSLEVGYEVEIWSDRDNQLYYTLVDGLGRIAANESRTNTDNYKIFPDHPGTTAQTTVAGPGAGNTESPSGWLSGAQTSLVIRGNNVSAYLDRDNNNSADGGGTPIADGNFVTTANLGQTPTTAGNQEVAVQNLFYFNNFIHDTLYRHGFVEGAGNFQNNNFGKGGAGNDAVNAEAQDGGGTNNANFSTPSDGSSGRMQMYLWTQSTPNRDGDVDSDIMWHEYGHGLTWRMIGGMGTAISGAIGEGMGDVLAILYNNNDVVGEYSYNRAGGIRRNPYTNYPRTLSDFTGSSVHNDGEIYAAIIWLLKDAYPSNDALLHDLVQGMNFTPSAPTFMDMRDGILAAVNDPGGADCAVWEAFAAFGAGSGSSMSVKGGGPFGGGKVSVRESFSLPSSCGSEPPPPPPPSGDVTLTAISGSVDTQGPNRWRATLSVSADLEGSVVAADWSDGSSSSCTISSGSCSMSQGFRNTVASVTATVVTINGGGFNLGGGLSSASYTFNRP